MLSKETLQLLKLPDKERMEEVVADMQREKEMRLLTSHEGQLEGDQVDQVPEMGQPRAKLQ